MRVLILATRDPGGAQTGRKSVLNTVVRSLVALDHEVHLVVLARQPPIVARQARPGVTVHHFRPPSTVRVLGSVLRRGLSGRHSLNECLYFTPGLARRVSALAESTGCEVVVADMIRTAELALATGLPVVLDLDDLLSARYAEQAALGASAATVLGYHRDNLPGPVVRVGSLVARHVLRRESVVIAARELSCARRSAVVSLVSPVERERFATVLGAPVAWLPMAVDPPRDAAPVAASEPRLYFTAKLDYEPNLVALRWFAREVAPTLARAHLHLEVIGHCPDAVRQEFAGSSIRFLGYVEDLWSQLSTGRAFLAPIVSGTGVKTKVLEAMAAGLPVVSTTRGVEGIPVEHGTSALVADAGPEFAEQVGTLVGSPERAALIGSRGRDLVSSGYTPRAVSDRWAEALAAAGSTRDRRPAAGLG